MDLTNLFSSGSELAVLPRHHAREIGIKIEAPSMADRLYLSLWFPSFNEAEMMPRSLAALKQFPYSSSQPGIRYLGIHAISWNEPLVFEQTFDTRATPE